MASSLEVPTDLFARIPTEIRVKILKALPDLSSLFNVICASRCMQETFNGFYLEIVNFIISDLDVELQQLFCAFTLIASQHHLPSILDRNIFPRDSDARCPVTGRTLYPDGVPSSPNPIPCGVSLSVVYGFLRNYSKTELITQAFLTHILDQLNNLEIRHPASDTYDIFSEIPSPDAELTDEPYMFPRNTLASWSERYRVMRAVWFIMVFLEANVDYWIFSNVKVKTPVEQICANLWEPTCRTYKDESRCVMEFLNNRRDFWAVRRNRAGDVSRKSRKLLLNHWPSNWKPAWEDRPLDDPPRDSASILWRQSIFATKRESRAYSALYQFELGFAHSPSQMKGLRWEYFRCLGFGLLDYKRMCSMQLIRAFHRPFTDPENKYMGNVGKYMSLGYMMLTWRGIRLNGKSIIDVYKEDREKRNVEKSGKPKGVSKNSSTPDLGH